MIMPRSKKLVLALVFAGLWFGGLAPARAADILFTATGTFDWDESYQQGFDQLGLDGAGFVFTARFSGTSLYQSYKGTGIPFIQSLSDSFTISGSPVAGVNGTYSAGGSGVILIPTFTGQFYGDDSFDNGGGYATWIPGRAPEFRNSIRLNGLTTAVSGPVVGGQFLQSHLSTTRLSNPGFLVQGLVDNAYGGIDIYSIRNFQASVTVVPEPSSVVLAVIAGGATAISVIRKRRTILR